MSSERKRARCSRQGTREKMSMSEGRACIDDQLLPKLVHVTRTFVLIATCVSSCTLSLSLSLSIRVPEWLARLPVHQGLHLQLQQEQHQPLDDITHERISLLCARIALLLLNRRQEGERMDASSEWQSTEEKNKDKKRTEGNSSKRAKNTHTDTYEEGGQRGRRRRRERRAITGHTRTLRGQNKWTSGE